jgi:hypothetical protein
MNIDPDGAAETVQIVRAAGGRMDSTHLRYTSFG